MLNKFVKSEPLVFKSIRIEKEERVVTNNLMKDIDFAIKVIEVTS